MDERAFHRGNLYASLTRLPVKRVSIHPSRVGDYLEAMNTVATGGWSGAKIYDPLLRCAANCPAERIYTFNLRDFQQLASAAW